MTCPVCRHPATGDVVNPGPEWGPTHRACFNRVDAISEAMEAATMAVPMPDPETGDLVGRRFGRFTVIAPARRWDRPAWKVRCDCGETMVVRDVNLSRGRCGACAHRSKAEAQSLYVGGRRVRDLAREAGLGIRTVLLRVKAGWPVERLTAPPDLTRLPKGSPRRAAA